MSKQHLVAVIGAGPAGMYGARKLTEAGHRVVLINRDIKPGGLAEYGIFPDKEKMKTGLRKQFKRILADPKVFYLGHVMLGKTKPSAHRISRKSVLSADRGHRGSAGNEEVGHKRRREPSASITPRMSSITSTRCRPSAERQFEIGRRVAIIGMGNVMVDVANWLLNQKKIDQVIVVARRGPMEKAYDDSEFEDIDSISTTPT